MIPSRGDMNLTPTPPSDRFIELEPNLFLVELEASTGIVELE